MTRRATAGRIVRCLICAAALLLALAGVARGQAQAPAGFGDAVARRVADLKRQQNAEQGPFTWAKLQQLAEEAAGYTLDPERGGTVWDIATLLQRASTQPDWLGDEASPEARELQLRQVFGLLTWQQANYGAYQTETAIRHKENTTSPGESCPASPSGGATPSESVRTLWANQLQQANMQSFVVQGFSNSSVGVTSTWSPSGYVYVEVSRRIENYALGDSAAVPPLPDRFLNGAAIFVAHGWAGNLPPDLQAPLNGRQPLTAAARPINSGRGILNADAEYGSWSIGEGSDVDLGDPGFRSKWALPLESLIQAGTNGNPKLVEGMQIVYGTVESPGGFPPTHVHVQCVSQYTQTTGGSTIAYSTEFPPLTGNTAATILGTVVDGADRPLPGIAVRLLGPGTISQEATTDELGGYSFAQLPPGDYRVEPVQPVGVVPDGFKILTCDNGAGAVTDIACVVHVAASSTNHRANFRLLLTDLQPQALEVTQGIQALQPLTSGPVSAPGFAALPGGTYAGVPLADSVPTVARLFAYVDPERSTEPEPNVSARLHAYRRGPLGLAELPGSPIDPVARSTLPEFPPLTRLGALANVGVFFFRLPVAWTTPGTVTLAGEIDAPSAVREHDESDNAIGLAGVGFRAQRPIEVHPVRIDYRFRRTQLTGPDLTSTFRRVRQVLPIRADYLRVSDFAQAPVADITADLAPIVEKYLLARPDMQDCFSKAVGTCDTAFRAVMLKAVKDARAGSPSRRDYSMGFSPSTVGAVASKVGGGEAVVTADSTRRPLTSLAHELVHLLGRDHAGKNCPGIGPPPLQEAESWPPDDTGLIGGVALDRAEGSGPAAGQSGPYRLFMSQPSGNFFDLMSYCAGGDAKAWISVRNWTRLVEEGSAAGAAAARINRPGRLIRVAATAGRALLVDAVVLGTGQVLLLGVRHVTAVTSPAAPGSPYSLVVRNAAGRVLSRRTVPATAMSDGAGAIISATVPARGATSVQILRAGMVVARRTAARRAPRVRLLAPRRNTRLPRRGKVGVRWRISGPRTKGRTTRVEVSTDGGRTWRPQAIGLTKTRTTIPGTLFAGSRRPRLRVIVNDGFNDATATSGRLR